ncbi:hypothetical protein DSM112329_00214 [Paraconexibacter sp. AEG42_29]|uniref:DUF4267 domain-containing protein n=1 Tax=Paraconexibacter sp. AEG42_29 TaxID=2997339 RepID=A0AAU7APH1_9ACTN
MPTEPAKILSSLRLGVGAGAWLAPGLAGRLFGLSPADNPQLSYMARLFGIRDVALAVGTTQTTGPSRRVWWQIGIACDLADAVAAYLGGRNGSLSKATVVLAGGTAVAAAGLGFAAMQADDA